MGNYQDEIKKYVSQRLDDDPYGKALEENAKKNKEELSEDEKKECQRLNFSPETRILLGARVGFICSYPECNQATIGPSGNGITVLGEAAHIYGAIHKKGCQSRTPRPAPFNYTENDITSIDNGIWLCRHHHRLVDAIWSQKKHSPEELKRWKKEAEERQARNLEIKESVFVAKYVNSQISVSKGIDTTDFSEREWCLLAYLMDVYDDMGRFGTNARFFESDMDGNCFYANYQDWMSENSINRSTSGISFDDYSERSFAELREICDKLTGLVKLNRDGIEYGKAFDDFCEDLIEDDEQAVKKIKLELARV